MSGPRRLIAYAASAALLATGAALLAAAGPAGAAAGPAVTVTPSAGLDPAGATITIAGRGFSTAGFGIYVGLADTAKVSPTNAAAFGVVKYVHTGATPSAGQDVLADDGSFSTTLDVKAVFGAGANATDCTVDTCAVVTMAARGSADRGQDTSTPVHFFAPALHPAATTGLTPGQTVSVAGAGYRPGKGVYIAQTVSRPDSGVPSNYGNAKWVQTVGADGTLSQDVTVTATFTPRGGTAVDCRAVQCYLASFNDHTDLANRDQDVWVLITFAAAPEPTDTSTSPSETSTSPSDPGSTSPSDPGSTTSPPGTPAVRVSPARDLAVDGATVTVTGAGFSADDPGIYVGIAAREHYDPSNADAFGTVKWVHVGATPSAGQDDLKSDGTFSTTLDVSATFGTGELATDCRVTQCAIYTLAAHGSADRSQDTVTNIFFAGADNPSTPTPTPTTSTSAPAGTIAISDRVAAPGDAVTVTATGFDAAEQVSALLHSDPVSLGISPADRAGDYRLTFTVPADVADGVHHVELTGLGSGLELRVAFTVATESDGSSAAGGSTSAPAAEGAGNSASGASPVAGLADTGADPGQGLALGLALLVGGAGLLLATRRRVRRH